MGLGEDGDGLSRQACEYLTVWETVLGESEGGAWERDAFRVFCVSGVPLDAVPSGRCYI